MDADETAGTVTWHRQPRPATGRRQAALPAFRAEVAGSLLRPPALVAARQARQQGRLTALQLWEAENRAVDHALALQQRAGMDVVTDGEYRRSMFLDPLSAVTGLGPVPAAPVTMHGDDGSSVNASSPYSIVERVSPPDRATTPAGYAYAAGRTGLPVKVTLPSPGMACMFWSDRTAEVYPDPVDLFGDLTAVLRLEIAELHEAGCRYIQLDAPELLQMFSPDDSKYLASLGWPLKSVAEHAPDMLSSLTRGFPDIRFGVHICRGNAAGRWMADHDYRAAARSLFPRLEGFDTVLLEYDDHRAGSFEPLAELPGDVQIVLGLVSTKRPAMESADILARRIERASWYTGGIGRLALSTQCGFASAVTGNPLKPQEQEQKLALVGKTARLVWK